MRYGVTETDNSVITHKLIVDRELPNQHPMHAISGLQLVLDEKYEKPRNGIPITDLGFNPATQEGLVALREEVIDRMIILDSEIVEIDNRVTATEDFLNLMFQDQSSGAELKPEIKFAYRSGFREEFITEDGDTDFHLINTFTADGKHLKIYRDGELLTPSFDYTEVTNNHISFNYPLEEDIYMSFICESMSKVISPVHEEIVSIQDQLEFELKNSYSLGDNSLSLYVKGLRLEQGADYEELGSNRIKLLIEPYLPGTKFIFRQEGLASAGQVLYHEADYQQKSWKVNLKAVEGQTVFEIGEVFIPGANMIHVTVNGLSQWEGKDFDYLEISDRAIEFNEPLLEDEVVSVICISQIYNWSEKFVSLQDQSVFGLQNIYYTGRDDIVVYENGLQLQCGPDYEEISNKAIKLTEVPPIGSRVTVFKRR